jgi:tRNA (guanosine-2'-O-)-methyltransferase
LRDDTLTPPDHIGGPEGRKAKFRKVLAERVGGVRLALEALYQRHNISAILRTADAVGIQDVHLVAGEFQASPGPARGAERWLSLHHEPSTEAAFDRLRADGFAVWVADLAEDSKTPEEVPLDQPVCLWFGTELTGVTPAARALADGVVTVPMRGFAQSLNVSVAAALTMNTLVSRYRARWGAQALLTEDHRQALFDAWAVRDEQLRLGIAKRLRR